MPDRQVMPTHDLETALRLTRQINMQAMSAAERGVFIHAVIRRMNEAVRGIDNLYLHVGMIWAFIMENKLYKFYGTHIRNANDFIRELNLGMSRSLLDHYARMYRTFGKYLTEHQLAVPLRKLLLANAGMQAEIKRRPEAIALTETDNAEITEQWVHRAHTLTFEDLNNEVRTVRGQERLATDVCAHPDDRSELWSRCGVCGKWLSMIPNPSVAVAPGSRPAPQEQSLPDSRADYGEAPAATARRERRAR